MRIHADQKFQALSDPAPSGKYLWLWLMIGPHTGIIPGLSMAGRARLAEDLGWEVEAFQEAFREVEAQGMAKADWRARVLWLPNAIKHNPPESPNVVTHWREAWDLIPECDLKYEALQSLKGFLEAKGQGFAEALRKAIPQAYAEDLREPGTGTGTGTGTGKNSPTARHAREREASSETPVPAELDAPDFREAWAAWKAQRRKLKIKPYTDRGEKEQLAALAALGPTGARDCIALSIRQGWQGLFPDKISGNGSRSRSKTASDKLVEEWQALAPQAFESPRPPEGDFACRCGWRGDYSLTAQGRCPTCGKGVLPESEAEIEGWIPPTDTAAPAAGGR